MKVSEFTDQYLKKLNEKEKNQFTLNAHKAFNAYINFVDSNDPLIKDVFFNVDKLYDEFKERYSANTVRNYCRYLQIALFLDRIKAEFSTAEFEDVKNKITKLVKEADKLSNEDHKKKKVDRKTDKKNNKKEVTIDTTVLPSENKDDQIILDDITINDGMSSSELSERLSEIEILKTDNDHLRHLIVETQNRLNLETQLKEVYKTELDRMYKLLELVYLK